MSVIVLTDATFYNSTYKTVMGAVTLPTDLVNKYLYKASQAVKRYTFSNINTSLPIADQVQMCVCEVAEELYITDKAKNERAGLKSYSNDGESGTFDDETTQESSDRRTSKIIYDHLADTGLLYAGGGYAEFKL